MVNKKKVCKNCKRLVNDEICPICNSKQIVDKYKGRVLVLNAKESEIAKTIGAEHNGNYAIKL